MKFTISQSELNTALSIVGKAVSTNRIIPILECVRFKIEKKTLYIHASNLREHIIKSVKVDCKDVIDIAIPYIKIRDLVKDLPNQPLVFEIDELQITITSDLGVYHLVGENGLDFPEPNDEVVATTKIQAEDLNEGIFRTLFACSSDGLRPAMQAICLDFESSKLRFTSVDGNIASTYLIECDIKLNNTCLFSENGARVIEQLALKGDVELKFADNHLIFEQDGLIIYSTLVHEKAPATRNVIPDNEFILTANRKYLIAAVNRVSKFAYHFVKFSLGKKCIIEAENIDFGQNAKEQIIGEYVGDDLIIGTSCDWLLKCLNHCITDEVFLYFSLPNKAIVIRESMATDKDNLMLCMPIMISAR